jgi:hypothetical protein
MKIIVTIEKEGTKVRVQTNEPAEVLLIDSDPGRSEYSKNKELMELIPGCGDVEVFYADALCEPELTENIFRDYHKLTNYPDPGLDQNQAQTQTRENLHDLFSQQIKDYFNATGIRVTNIDTDWRVFKDMNWKDTGTYLAGLDIQTTK